jgi:hypothetical protein
MGQINTTNSFELSAGNAKIIGKISEKLPNNKKMAALGTTPLALVLSACGGSETSTTASNVLTLTKSADTYSASAVTGFAVTDSSTAKFAVADAASNAYEIKLDATGTGVLEFDFVDAGDTVTLAAGSKSSGFTTLKVTDGTLDATNADLTGITRVEVASGIKISLAQIKEIPTVVANSATSEITVEVTSEAEATELVSLISAGTVKIFADTNPIKLVAASTATVTAETLTAKQTETTASVKPTAEAPADTAATDTTDTGTGTGTGTDTDTGSTDSTGGGAAPVIGGSPTTVPVTHSGSGNYVMGTDSGAVTLTVDGSNLKATPEVGSATMVTKANVSDLRSDIAISGTAAVFEGFTTSGSGNVTITGSDGAQTLTINSTGTNSVAGGAGIDTITVSVGTNTITGGGGADVLVGGSGADNFVVAALADVSGLAESIDGGAGSSDKITMGLTGAADLSAATIANVESIVFHASGNTLTVDYDDLGTTAGLVSTLTGGAGTDVVVIDEATFDASGLTLTSIDTLTTTDGTASAVWKVVGTQVSSSEVTTLTSANDGAADELQFTGGTLNLTGVTATNGLDKITSTATSGAVGITAADNGYIDGATVTVTAATSGLTTLTSSGTAHNITGVTFANSNGKFKIANATDSAVLTLDDADLADTAGKISSIALSGSGTEGVTSSGATLDVSDVTLSGVEVLTTTDSSNSAVWTVLGAQLGTSKVTTLTSADAGAADELQFSDAALDLTNVTAGNGLDKITSTATSGGVSITAADDAYIDGATVTVTAATSGTATLITSGTATDLTGVTLANATSSTGRFGVTNETTSATITVADANLADTQGKINAVTMKAGGTDVLKTADATFDITGVTLSGVETVESSIANSSSITMVASQLGGSNVTTVKADGNGTDTLILSGTGTFDLSGVTLTSIEAVKGVGATVQTFVSHAGATAFDLVTTGAVDTIQFTATSQFADTIANFEVGDGKDVIQTSISGVTINQGATAQTALLTGASGSKVATVATAYAGSGANENAKGIIIISDEAATNWSDVGTVIAGALTIDGTAADNAKAIVAVDNGVDVRAYLFSDVTDGTSFSDDFTLIATLSGVSDVTTLSADNFTIA